MSLFFVAPSPPQPKVSQNRPCKSLVVPWEIFLALLIISHWSQSHYQFVVIMWKEFALLLPMGLDVYCTAMTCILSEMTCGLGSSLQFSRNVEVL